MIPEAERTLSINLLLLRVSFAAAEFMQHFGRCHPHPPAAENFLRLYGRVGKCEALRKRKRASPKKKKLVKTFPPLVSGSLGNISRALRV
jgi:hypothetical protein